MERCMKVCSVRFEWFRSLARQRRGIRYTRIPCVRSFFVFLCGTGEGRMSRRCNDISKTAKDHVFRPHISSIPIEGTKEMQLGTCFEVIRHSSPENFVPTHPTQPATPTSPRKTSFAPRRPISQGQDSSKLFRGQHAWSKRDAHNVHHPELEQ